MACVKVCPNNAHKMIDGRHVLDRVACTLHGACVNACAIKALDIVGSDVTTEEVITKVMRDIRYYETSHGGVTISGGEPTLQTEFLLSLLQRLKENNIHTAVETSGMARYDIYEKILPYVDLFLFDYKETNPELHKKFTGAGNKLILENLKKLHDARANILLRCPVIYTLNDRDDHFKGIVELVREHKNLAGVEILPYHKLGASKIGRMGLPVQEEYEQVPRETSDKWRQILREYGVKVVES
jgi:pyruvate formate lyase activating enzyme